MQAIMFVATVAASTFWTANDPFVGHWKLDVSRSTIVDDMKVENLGPNKYAFNFENSPTETIIADGTDQPGLSGTTLSVKQADDRTLSVIRKQDGKVIVSAHWKLSPDGRTLRDAFTALQDDGSNLSTDYVYRRTAGTSGFAGAWESTTKPMGLKLEMDIHPYGNEGLSFTSLGSKKSVTFDGRDHPAEGAKDVTFSGRRHGARAMDYTEKNAGEVAHLRAFQLSPDGRTLTETLRTPGHSVPDVFVFQRTE